jgi:hypothetical protein
VSAQKFTERTTAAVAMRRERRDVARHGDLQTLAERKVEAALKFETKLDEVAAARREMAAAEYDWSAACLSLAGLHRDGRDTRQRRMA